MTNSFTQTSAKTITYANVRYINDKIIADLDYVLTLYPNIFTRDRLEKWKLDFYDWIFNGYVSAITTQFYRNNECFYEVKWDIKSDGTILSDQNTGKIRGNLTGATTGIVISFTDKWINLSQAEKDKFYASLEISWGPVGLTNYKAGLTVKLDKQYSSGDIGVQRSIMSE